MLFLQLQVWSLWLLQEAAVGWDVRSLWAQMGPLAKIVVIGLFFMSAWSIGVMIDRLLAYNAARKQSRAFAPAVAGVSPMMERTVVVLPMPLRPISVTISPGPTASETLNSTWLNP